MRKYENNQILDAVCFYHTLMNSMNVEEEVAVVTASERYKILASTLRMYHTQMFAMMNLINDIRPDMSTLSKIWEKVHGMFDWSESGQAVNH